MAYQAVFDAFNKMVVGSINTGEFTQHVINTRMVSTVLFETEDVAFTRANANGGNMRTTFDVLGIGELSGFPLEVSDTASSRNMSMLNALEELFQNVTISLMTSGGLQ